MHDRRHELGQNFLADSRSIDTILRVVGEATGGPILELGGGEGALTVPLSRLGRPLTVLEIDPRRAGRLTRRVPGHVQVINADALSYKLPEDARTIVGNIPFHLTTAILKKLLAAPHWQDAVLVVQWEVARRRAGVGGASMLTAQWWPWYRFQVHARIPAAAFRPAPSVDAGLLSMHRRLRPLVGELRADDRADSRAVLRADTRAADVGADARADVRSYQEFVRQIFTGRGPALAEILARSGRFPRRAPLQDWLRAEALPARALAKDLTAEQWAALWRLSAGGGRHNAALVSGRSGSGAAGSPRRGRRGA